MHLTRRDQKGSQGTMRFSLQLDNAQARVSMEECWPNICEALGAINPAPQLPQPLTTLTLPSTFLKWQF